MADKDSIGIGIIGTGFARRTQLPAFRACDGARVVSIASAHRDHAERAAREFDIKHFTDDWREVVARDDVDLVSIVTPPSRHLEMTLAALNARKAVLCEKPMAMDAKQTGIMSSRAIETGALALVDHELRFLHARRKMREMLLAGEIGEVHHANFLFRADSRLDTARPWDWWSDSVAGGGALGAIGSHAVDSFRWILGTEISLVFGLLSTHIKQRPVQQTGALRPVTTDDEVNMTLLFADSEVTKDATGTVSISVVESGRPEHRLEIFGSNGALLVEGPKLWRAARAHGMWQPLDADEGELAPGMSDDEWSRGFAAFARTIIEALREGRNTVEGAATFEDGHQTQLVLDAARRSHEKGCWSTVSDLSR